MCVMKFGSVLTFVTILEWHDGQIVLIGRFSTVKRKIKLKTPKNTSILNYNYNYCVRTSKE